MAPERALLAAIDRSNAASRAGSAAADIARRWQRLLAGGSRGLGPIQRFAFRSASAKILHAATGPVLIAPGAHERKVSGP